MLIPPNVNRKLNYIYQEYMTLDAVAKPIIAVYHENGSISAVFYKDTVHHERMDQVWFKPSYAGALRLTPQDYKRFSDMADAEDLAEYKEQQVRAILLL